MPDRSKESEVLPRVPATPTAPLPDEGTRTTFTSWTTPWRLDGPWWVRKWRWVKHPLHPWTKPDDREGYDAVFIGDSVEGRLGDARTLISEAMEQLSPPAFYGPGSWWERALDWLEHNIGDAGAQDATINAVGQAPRPVPTPSEGPET